MPDPTVTVRIALPTRVHMPPGHRCPSSRKPRHLGQVAMRCEIVAWRPTLRCGYVEPDLHVGYRAIDLEASPLRQIYWTREPVPLVPAAACDESGECKTRPIGPNRVDADRRLAPRRHDANGDGLQVIRDRLCAR